MEKLLEQLKGVGFELPEENKAEFEKAFRAAYKSVGEHGKVTEKLTAAEEALKVANETIKSFGEAGFNSPDDIKAKIGEYEKQAGETKAQYEARIADMELNGFLGEKLPEKMFSSKAARKAIMQEVKEKGLKYENGALLGFDDVLKGIKEADPESFASETPPPKFIGGGADPIKKPIADDEMKSWRKDAGLKD